MERNVITGLQEKQKFHTKLDGCYIKTNQKTTVTVTAVNWQDLDLPQMQVSGYTCEGHIY